MMKKFYGYLKKDFMLLYKRKKYLAVFILLPLIISFLFLFALNPGSYNIKTGVCDFDNTEYSRDAFVNLKGFDVVSVEEDGCIDNLKEAIKKGELDLGLVIGKGFSENLENLKQSKMIIFYDNSDVAFANLVSWKIDSSMQYFERGIIDALNSELKDNVESARRNIDVVKDVGRFSKIIDERIKSVDSDLKMIEDMETEFIVNPIWTDKKGVYDSEVDDAGIAFVFPLLALFIVLMLSSVSVIYDKKSGFITRVKSSTSPFVYLLAKVLFFVFIVALQFLIIFLIFLAYGSSYSLNFFNILELVVYVAVVDCLIGFLIGLIADNEGMAVLFSLILAFPLMLVSGVFFPIQAMPNFVRYVAGILPLNYQVEASKAVLLFGENASNEWMWLAGGLFLVVWWVLRRK